MLPVGAGDRPLAEFLATTGTTSFVVLHRGRRIWQHAAHGGAPDRPARCFSVTKSVASALLGIAVGARRVESLQEPIATGCPSCATRASRC